MLIYHHTLETGESPKFNLPNLSNLKCQIKWSKSVEQKWIGHRLGPCCVLPEIPSVTGEKWKSKGQLGLLWDIFTGVIFFECV